MGRCVSVGIWQDIQTLMHCTLGGCFYFILLQKTERIEKMKKTINSAIYVMLSLLFALCLGACTNTPDSTGLWENAMYTEDTEFGEGANTAVVEVKIEDKTVTFTVHTDKTTVGEALLEHNLISGDQGDYGLYIKNVNGVTADYDIDQSYWAFYVNGEYATAGADGTEITEGTVYRLEYTK